MFSLYFICVRIHILSYWTDTLIRKVCVVENDYIDIKHKLTKLSTNK